MLLEAAAGSPVRGAVTGASAGAPAGAALAGSDPRLHASADHGAALAGSAASDLTKFQDASFLHSVLGSLPGVGAVGGVGDVSDLDEVLAQAPSPPMAAPAPTMAPSRNLFSFHRSGSSGVEAAGEHAVSLAPRSFFERAPTGSMGMAPTMAPTGSMGMPIHPSAASGAVSGAGSGSSAASGAGPSAGAHHDAPSALPLPAAPPKLSSSWTLPKPQLNARVRTEKKIFQSQSKRVRGTSENEKPSCSPRLQAIPVQILLRDRYRPLAKHGLGVGRLGNTPESGLTF